MEELRKKLTEEILATQPQVHHIERFQVLLQEWLPQMILEHAGLDTTFEDRGQSYRFLVKVSNYKCIRQQMSPDDAHHCNLNYAVDLAVDLKMHVFCDQKLVHTDELSEHIICSFPNMLHSVGCRLSEGCGLTSRIQHEVGGSFIMRGKRRFIPYMSRLHYDEAFFFRVKGVCLCEVRSRHPDRPHRSTSTIQLTMTQYKKSRGVGQTHLVQANLPFLTPAVPLHVLILALGFDFAAFERLLYLMDVDPEYLQTLIGSYVRRMRFVHRGCHTQREALLHIAGLYKRSDPCEEKLIRSVTSTLHSEVLPHLNFVAADHTNYLKVSYLAWRTGQLYRFDEGQLPETIRDSLQHQVVDGAAELLALLFRPAIINFSKQGVKMLRRVIKLKLSTKKRRRAGAAAAESVPASPLYEAVKLDKIYNSARLTPKLMSAVSTGRWSEDKKGVSHPMRTTNATLILSQLRRISSSFLSTQGKHIGPRMIHDTSYGYICAAETPDGESCGLVYTLAKTCRITPDGQAAALTELLLQVHWREWFVPLWPEPQKVELHWWKFEGPDGILWGWLTDVEAAVKLFRRLRRALLIDPFSSITPQAAQKTVMVKTSAGRYTRPLIVVENVKKLPDLPRWSFQQLLVHGVIEFLDPSEIHCGPENVCVALWPRDVQPFHTHLELCCDVFLGLVASNLIYFRHNQGPRLVYEIGMRKQYISPEALDDYGANSSHRLHYGQQPIVRTAYDSETSCDGTNVVVAFFPHDRAQEDALVIKKEAVERGLFTNTSLRTHSATHTPRNPNQPQDLFEKPVRGRTFALKTGHTLEEDPYCNLQNNGLPKVGTEMKVGQVVIGRTIPHSHISSAARVKVPSEFKDPSYTEYRRDASLQLRKNEAGIVHEVINVPNMRRVIIRTVHTLQTGDKLSNMHGQKGTVGRIEEAINMPFCEQTGISPDVICGPTCMPSRMTVGCMLEVLVGKAVAMSALKELGIEEREWDSGVTERTIKIMGEIMVKAGFRRSGRQRLRDGMTGNLLECDIFMGLMHYSKMDHMVCKKAHARGRGPIQPITRQPVEGRRKDGGFRFGPMEIDVLANYGVSHVFAERTRDVSDCVTVYFCKTCGFAADGNPDINYYTCRYCQSAAGVRVLKMSNSSIVMFTELAADGLSIRLKLKDKPQDLMEMRQKGQILWQGHSFTQPECQS